MSITLDMLEKVGYDKNDWDIIAWANKVIDAKLFKPYHGQAFHFIGQSYRNENLLFWHKEKGVITPYTEIDDYGSVPPDFLVGDEFRPDEWSNMVDHNSFVFLQPSLVEEIKETAKYVEKGKFWHTSVVIKSEVFAVKINMENIDKIGNVFHYYDNCLIKEL